MRIVHSEASLGWGGQEIRIFREALAFRDRGHDVAFVTAPGARLAQRARDAGFEVLELPMHKSAWPRVLPQLRRWLRRKETQIVNTHSSADSWTCGVAARLSGVALVRTRHLSTPSRPGLNSRIVYRWLADRVVTTCEEAAKAIRQLTGRSSDHCRSIPTGIDENLLDVSTHDVDLFRSTHQIPKDCLLMGTVCVLRKWKGIDDLLHAIKLCQDFESAHWLIVGDGPQADKLRALSKELGIAERVTFTGHVEIPLVATAALDCFILLSTANEGVSQASIQAAGLAKPQITTRVGGLHEVCIEGQTGLNVPTHDPQSVAQAMRKLYNNKDLRLKMGRSAAELARQRFLLKQTIDQMETVFEELLAST